MGREFQRRRYGFTKHHQECVKRRAILSVTANPNCSSPEQAAQAVNQVWDVCFQDTRPFDQVGFHVGDCTDQIYK
jgi:inner membrane protease ATP23